MAAPESTPHGTRPGEATARCAAPIEYDLLEHTADIGILVAGIDLAEIFAKAALALADLQFDPGKVRGRKQREVRLEDDDRERLLVRWLNELIFIRETEDFLWSAVSVEFAEPGGLRALFEGEPFDETRHAPRTGIKAATYHQLQIGKTPAGAFARVIFDV